MIGFKVYLSCYSEQFGPIHFLRKSADGIMGSFMILARHDQKRPCQFPCTGTLHFAFHVKNKQTGLKTSFPVFLSIETLGLKARNV